MSNEDELAIPSESLLQEIQTNEDTSEVLTQNIGVSDGDFRGSQMGGTRVYKTEYNVYNVPRSASKAQRSQVQENKDSVQLSDTIRMFKNQKVKSKSESKIFLGEQTSGVTGSRQIAVKLLEYNEKTIQEAKNLLKLVENPNVVSIVHSDKFEQVATSHVYIAMELCDTQNLYDYVTESTKYLFDPKLSISQATQIVSGLDFIHDKDIIHRDLNPHNVLFSLNKKILKIADFGLSKQMVSGRSVTKVVNPGAGTNGYRAPETYNRDEISKYADVYSLGLTCYFLWSRGRHPFGEDPDDWNSNIKKNRNRDLSQLTLLPDAAKAEAVIEAMLKFEPKQRPTAKEILADVFFSADARARPVPGDRSEDRIRPESQQTLDQTGPSSYLELQHESRGGAQSIKTTAVTRSKSVGPSSGDTKFENPPFVALPSTSLDVRRADRDELATTSNKNPHGISVKGGDFRGSNLGCSVTTNEEHLYNVQGDVVNQQVVHYYQHHHHNDGGSSLPIEGTEREAQIIEGPNTAHETSEDELCQSPSKIDSARITEFAGQLEKLNILKKPFDRKYCYVLITSTFQNSNADLKSLVEIPWMQVFDFDPKSEVKGFLSKVEMVLKSRRHYTVNESQSAVLDENVTNWIFINGHCNIANADIPTEHEINAKLMRLHYESLTAYCQGRKVPFVLVLWYPRNSNSDKNLEKFISILEYYMETSVNSFKCIFCVSTKPNDKAPFGKMINQRKFKNVIVVPLEVICAWLSENNRNSEVQDAVSMKRTIPKFSEKVKSKESFDIENIKYNWLNVCFRVLLVNEVTTEGKQNLTEKGEDYLKGGKLSWDVIASGSYDAERDLLEEKKRVIQQQFIETGKSGIISIYHSPGSGGTTFARRLLWELRKDAPCLELKATEFTIDEVKERLTFIRNETHLSPILLIDGNSTYDAKTLLEFCRYERPVILYVQRVYSLSPGEGNKKADEIWLPERLSLSEAKLLTGIFSQAKPESKRRLMSLTDDIEFGKYHVMFEYGLTAYESDFRGFRRYVHGNLRIKAKSKELEGWQLALAYLSLANYYGQCALPCKLFGSLLGKKGEDIVRIEDLPHSGQKFITEDECGEWNISYYTVAKEILEQVLAKRDSTDYKSEGNYLSDEACRELSKLALMFIDFIKDNLSDTNYIPSYFKDILTWIFIIGNYENTPEKDKSGSKHSRLVEDTKNPEDKQRILEKLVKCFPNDADFHAHLGRFFSRTKKPNEASECFENAIAVRLRNVTEKSKKRGDAGLCRFHHMYGHHLSQLMRTEIQEYQVPGNTARHSSVTVILDYADQAVTQFSNSVKFYQIGCSASYIYLGEIDVRICIAELYHEIKQLHLPSALKKRLNDFVLKSFSRCDHLISECIYYSANDDIPQNVIDKYINKFIAFFHNTEQALKKWAGNDEGIHSKRCHISIMKMNKGYKRNNKQSFVYDFMTNGQEVEEFISLCEGIFEDAEREVQRECHISHNMLEWLQAIRHPKLTKRYTLIDVERSVSKWDNRKERGSLSTYYHYVLTTLVAICGPNSQTCNTYSEKSGKLRDELTSEAMIPRFLMDRSFEWLAICEDAQFFNNSIYYSRLGEFDGKFWKSTEKIACLRACKGTIRRCEIHRGLIVLDGAHKPSICVFFNPQRYGFYTYEGKQSQRVEFYLGFNPKHGAEAYQIRKLDKTECRDCKTSVETPKLGSATSWLTAKCPSCNNTIRYSA